MRTVKIQVEWAAAHPGQDRQFPGVVTHPRPQRAPARSGVVIQVNLTLASGSLSTGSPAGRAPPHGDTMYSQAYVMAGKSCGSQLERSRP